MRALLPVTQRGWSLPPREGHCCHNPPERGRSVAPLALAISYSGKCPGAPQKVPSCHSLPPLSDCSFPAIHSSNPTGEPTDQGCVTRAHPGQRQVGERSCPSTCLMQRWAG